MTREELMEENEQFRSMQGSLNENRKWEDFIHSDELGWLQVTMEEIADEQNLDMDYRSDFNIAFDEAISRLKVEQPQLDFDLIQTYKEKIFTGQ